MMTQAAKPKTTGKILFLLAKVGWVGTWVTIGGGAVFLKSGLSCSSNIRFSLRSAPLRMGHTRILCFSLRESRNFKSGACK